MDGKQVVEMFNKKTRIGALATSNKSGDVNAAVFGSPRMINEKGRLDKSPVVTLLSRSLAAFLSYYHFNTHILPFIFSTLSKKGINATS